MYSTCTQTGTCCVCTAHTAGSHTHLAAAMHTPTVNTLHTHIVPSHTCYVACTHPPCVLCTDTCTLHAFTRICSHAYTRVHTHAWKTHTYRYKYIEITLCMHTNTFLTGQWARGDVPCISPSQDGGLPVLLLHFPHPQAELCCGCAASDFPADSSWWHRGRSQFVPAWTAGRCGGDGGSGAGRGSGPRYVSD